MKIFLSPSNQDDNRYAYGNTTEYEQCGKIARALQTMLEHCGFEVMLMHDENMSTKVAAANKWGADLYIPIHSNAFNGEVMGTRMFFGKVGTEGEKLCNAIFNRLAPITPGTSENTKPNPGLYEIANPEAWTAYVEIDFHDAPVAAKWIIEHTEDIAEAICQGVCDYAKVEYKAVAQEQSKQETASSEGNLLYRVQVGAFRNRDNAERLMNELKSKGYSDAFLSIAKL